MFNDHAVRLWQTRSPVRVVLDTNILLSACWTPSGLEARIVDLAIEGRIVLCTSDAVWEEYREVLHRKKFVSRTAPIQAMLDRLERTSVRVTPTQVVTAATDDDDNRFLECAEAAAVQYLVTGNLHDYPRVWQVTRVVNAREFLNSWEAAQHAPPGDV